MTHEEEVNLVSDRITVAEKAQTEFLAKYGEDPRLYSPSAVRKMNALLKELKRLVRDHERLAAKYDTQKATSQREVGRMLQPM